MGKTDNKKGIMISNVPIVRALIHLNVREAKNSLLDLVTGRIFGSTLFAYLIRPARWYQDIADDISARSARKIRLQFHKQAEKKFETIARKVTKKICSESFFIEVQEKVVDTMSADWIKYMHQSESRIIPSVKCLMDIINFSIESLRSYPDENPLKQKVVRNLTNLIDRQFPLVYISNDKTKLLIEVLVTHFFSSSPDRMENIHQAIAATVKMSVEPYVFQAVKSGLFDALPTMADAVETLAKVSTSCMTDWTTRELCSMLSSTGAAFAGYSLYSDESLNPIFLLGSVLIANMGLWGLQFLQSSSTEVDIEDFCDQLKLRYGHQLRRYLAESLADLHNRWVPKSFHRNSRDFHDTVPDELIDKGIRLILETVLLELKVIT